ncbi:hypothetical protein AB6A40_009985 [Gnathostoma spinigerum]|uniref:Secreted protein n=1 Tax=Gnathostoma spinigerum TaxID=75299 RepID=A0ABD6F088_9BILA
MITVAKRIRWPLCLVIPYFVDAHCKSSITLNNDARASFAVGSNINGIFFSFNSKAHVYWSRYSPIRFSTAVNASVS